MSLSDAGYTNLQECTLLSADDKAIPQDQVAAFVCREVTMKVESPVMALLSPTKHRKVCLVMWKNGRTVVAVEGKEGMRLENNAGSAVPTELPLAQWNTRLSVIDTTVALRCYVETMLFPMLEHLAKTHKSAVTSAHGATGVRNKPKI